MTFSFQSADGEPAIKAGALRAYALEMGRILADLVYDGVVAPEEDQPHSIPEEKP